MERYKFTFADGSSTEEAFDSDNEAIVAATAVNGGSGRRIARPALRPLRGVVVHETASRRAPGNTVSAYRTASAASDSARGGPVGGVCGMGWVTGGEMV
jgi:hypothetical protein